MIRQWMAGICLGWLATHELALAGDGAALARAQGIAYPAVIAHRGASFDAPESTAPAYLLARELGADYLELDLRRTRDGALVVLHDGDLLRTTDVAQRFAQRTGDPVSAFTLAELQSLDVGNWFNQAYPERARAGFSGLKVLTLQDVMEIAEGNPLKRPGLYIEPKVTGIEQELYQALQARGWLDTPGRVVLQSFSPDTLARMHALMPQVPKVLLLRIGRSGIEPLSGQTFAESGETDRAAFYARQQPRDRAEFERWLDHAQAAGAIGTGASAALSKGGDQSYAELVSPWMNSLARARGLLVHVYTVDEAVDFARVSDAGVDGIITNRSGQLLRFYDRPGVVDEASVLNRLGY